MEQKRRNKAQQKELEKIYKEDAKLEKAMDKVAKGKEAKARDLEEKKEKRGENDGQATCSYRQRSRE